MPSDIRHAFYKYYCFVDNSALKSGWSRDRIAREISAAGVPCFSGTCWNISAEKAFADRGWSRTKEELPNAYALKDSSLMLLVHPTIEQTDMQRACDVIENTLTLAQR